MIDRYEVEQTKQASGIMFAVVFNGYYRFFKKTAKEAYLLANRLNTIRKRRVENI